MLVKCAGGAKIFDSPAHVKEFVAGNHFAGARGEDKEQPQFARRHFTHLQPGFLQAHLAWSAQQVQSLPLSHAQAASLAQLHLSPQEQGFFRNVKCHTNVKVWLFVVWPRL